jgi:hypothetical protein
MRFMIAWESVFVKPDPGRVPGLRMEAKVEPAAKRSRLAHEQHGGPYERGGRVRHPIPEEIPMTEQPKVSHTQPGGFVEEDESAEDGVENDSLGTIDVADSTGIDEKKETGDAKDQNNATRED